MKKLIAISLIALFLYCSPKSQANIGVSLSIVGASIFGTAAMNGGTLTTWGDGTQATWGDGTNVKWSGS